ncbi:MAG: hypothetical protein ACI92G_002804 [Candidatus Pelagisphaera sp.]|jgi:hypothetical protein
MFENQKLAFEQSNTLLVLRSEEMIFELEQNEKTNEPDLINSL